MAAVVGSFKAEFDFDRRAEVAAKIRVKYPDRIPVIVEKAPNSNIANCNKRKFLVPQSLAIGNFMYEIRKNMPELDPKQSIFLFVDNTLPSSSALMSDIFEKHKDEDGFLYLTYSGENVFGSCN